MNVFVVAIIVMLICAAFGAVTGFFIAHLSVPPFIATLAMMEIVYVILHDLYKCDTAGRLCEGVYQCSFREILGINYLIWIAIIVAAITWFIFNMTRHGKYMYAIGGNRRQQRLQVLLGKENLDLDLYEGGCNVRSCGLYARCKIRRSVCTAWIRL